MKLIIDQLKQSIILHPIIKNSTLGNTKIWKRAQFIILSEIVAEVLSKSEHIQGAKKSELGTTISSITLQRLFTDNYTEKENPDLRFLKTLDKLAIFIGYPSLNGFISDNNNQKKAKENHLPEIMGFNVLGSILEKLIADYCQEEFNCMLKLPIVEISSLSKYVFDDGPLKKRIHDVLSKYAELNFKINDNGNRSNFEIYDFKIISIEDNLAVVTAKEFWNIEWKDENDNTAKIYNKINLQTYFIKKQNGHWKIWDNHNPDYSALINEVADVAEKRKKIKI